jgi:hypothetical protein
MEAQDGDILVEKEQWITMDPNTQPPGTTKEYWEKMDIRQRSYVVSCHVSGHINSCHVKHEMDNGQ